VAGVTNLHGRILSVVDLRAYFGLPAGLPASSQKENGVFILVRIPGMEVIFLVDDVPGVEILPVRSGVAEDALLHQLRPEYVQAMVERGGGEGEQRHLLVLNVKALLSDPRFVVHEELV
jgi:purine-binding chemotaxis protein CheW